MEGIGDKTGEGTKDKGRGQKMVWDGGGDRGQGTRGQGKGDGSERGDKEERAGNKGQGMKDGGQEGDRGRKVG